MGKKIAVFDIDGTLIRWQMYHAITDELIRLGYFDKEKFNSIKAARFDWKERKSSDSYAEYERQLILAFDASLPKITHSQFLEGVDAAFNKHKNQTYRYTRELIKELKSRNYLLFAISGSDENVVKLIAKHYGFDDFGGSQYELNGTKFTGNYKILTHDNKPKYLEELLEKHDASLFGSIAVGDSDGDIPLLNSVENPIAFNPNSKLMNHAKKLGWKIVIERKNVSYELEKTGENYELTETNV